MAKILLVEDDNNLREIYEARLQAEGYEIVSAKDGEEALVIAKKQRPDLIIADVMMPRVSGFEMLDILRNTPELKDVHVIMLTALGQAEDKTRADSLGADRYLVKSQVTLEDIVKSAADVLAGAPAGTSAMAAAAADTSQPAPAATPAAIPVAAEPVAVPVAAAPSVLAPDLTTPAVPTTPNPPAPVPPTGITTPNPQGPPPLAPPTQAATPVPSDHSTTDSQLVSNAVNDLVAGTNPPDATVQTPAPTPTVTPQITPAAPAPATPIPQPPLTMQPVLTPPVAAAPSATVPPNPAPATPQPPVVTDVTPPAAPTARKAITPLPAAANPAPTDLNDLAAMEGHNMDDGQPFSNLNHFPGNVITPGGPAPTPSMPNPADPNSISL